MIIDTKRKSAIKKIARSKGLDFVVVFGSAARGKTHKESDIDLAIKTSKSFS